MRGPNEGDIMGLGLRFSPLEWVPDDNRFDFGGAALTNFSGGVGGLPVPGTSRYVNSNLTNNGNGNSWDSAFNDLAAALIAMENWDTLFVAPGGYTGDFETPLNANAAFCRVIGVQGGAFGVGPYLSAASGAGIIMDIRARGWLFSGFELDLPATGKGFQLNETDAGARADYTQIMNCYINGQGSSKVGIDFYGGHNVFSKIYNNEFTGIYNGGGTAQAIGCSSSPVDAPSNADVAGNHFLDNDKHIGMDGARGFKSSRIHHNSFVGTGLSKTATKIVDNTGGGYNSIWQNQFGGTYSIVGGYVGATGDQWGGNYHMSDGGGVTGGITDTAPA
jgi:hypothetical protein